MLSIVIALIGDFASSAEAATDHAPVRASAPRSVPSLFIDDQRMERVLLELVPAVKERELDHECHPHDVAAELADQPQGCPHRTTGGEQIVDCEHTLPG